MTRPAHTSRSLVLLKEMCSNENRGEKRSPIEYNRTSEKKTVFG